MKIFDLIIRKYYKFIVQIRLEAVMNIFSCVFALLQLMGIPWRAAVINFIIRTIDDAVQLEWNHFAIKSRWSDREAFVVT